MTQVEFILVAFAAFLFIAFLYSSVGHAGASGYLAIMALLSFPIESIKPISLILNIVVASIATYKYVSAGFFDKKIFLAFAVTSIPLAFIGGYAKVDPELFKLGAGIFLIISSILLIIRRYVRPSDDLKELNLPVALAIGAVIGLISGLLGVGGGIFLSPVIIMLGWTTIKNASGIAALFILCNSLLGLLGHFLAFKNIEMEIFYWVVAVAIGGFLGSHFGTRRFNNNLILILLSIVLITAGLKFILV